MVMRKVLVVEVLVVLALFNNIISRTSSKQKAIILIMSHIKEAHAQRAYLTNKPTITL